jgi:hypothetical protein
MTGHDSNEPEHHTYPTSLTNADVPRPHTD